MDEDPRTTEEEPVGHVVQTLAPCAIAYVPAGQKTHALALVAPVRFENAPAGHGTHTPAPVTVLYCPAGHAVQVAPFAPVFPASHVQLLMNPLEFGAREFSGHRLQFALPSGDHCPSGHARHVSMPTAPKLAEARPTEHLEHAVRPSWLLYVPWVHITQLYEPDACAYPLLQEQYACDTLPATDTAFAWHEVQEEADAAENVSIGQFVHALTLLAPVTPMYFPAKHPVHALAPATSE